MSSQRQATATARPGPGLARLALGLALGLAFGLAFGLGPAVGLAAPVLPAEPLPRLAATLVTPGHVAALLESAAGQSWAVPGEMVGECRLLQVDAAGASFGCGAGERQLRLAAGDPHVVNPAAAAAPFTPVMAGVQLSADALRAITQNPQASALGIDIMPVSRGGQVIGWAVSRLDPASPVGAIGLQEDDLVVAVDGASARQPEAFMAALRALPDAGSFMVELLRDGRPTALLVAVSPPVSR